MEVASRATDCMPSEPGAEGRCNAESFSLVNEPKLYLHPRPAGGWILLITRPGVGRRTRDVLKEAIH